MFIAVDFDGTIVDHRFPDIGDPVPFAARWLKQFREAGAQLILLTMRSDTPAYGPTLTQAVECCTKLGIQFDHINDNPMEWTNSRKVYAHVYIDDSAFGCPLIENRRTGGRPYVDWSIVGPAVMKMIEG